jgi:hypothetical protein
MRRRTPENEGRSEEDIGGWQFSTVPANRSLFPTFSLEEDALCATCSLPTSNAETVTLLPFLDCGEAHILSSRAAKCGERRRHRGVREGAVDADGNESASACLAAAMPGTLRVPSPSHLYHLANELHRNRARSRFTGADVARSPAVKDRMIRGSEALPGEPQTRGGCLCSLAGEIWHEEEENDTSWETLCYYTWFCRSTQGSSMRREMGSAQFRLKSPNPDCRHQMDNLNRLYTIFIRL